MGLFALLTRFLSRQQQRPCFAAAPFAPLRLERRRVLDGAAPGLMLEALADVQPFVQTGENPATLQDAPEATSDVAQLNGFPEVSLRVRDAELFENESTLAVISIRDSSPMAHEVTIDWGDGSPLQVINVGAQVRDVLAVHQYLDDPAGIGDGTFTITATVKNTLGEEASSSTSVLVKNRPPTIDDLTITSPVDENGTVTLSGTYSDPGTLDTHTLSIDWNGDGTFDETLAVSGGSFSITRQVLDDGPTSMPSDSLVVSVRLQDDDGASETRFVDLTVNNVAPEFLNVSITSPIVENGTATITGTYHDPGTLDFHILEVDWDGDGIYESPITVSGGSFSVSRQFLDETAGPITINLRLRDDDGGEDVTQVELVVENAAPTVVLDAISPIDEGGTAVLTGTYSDPGTLDTHEIDIDWDGDGTFDETVAVTGGAFTVTRQFLDDRPGAQSDTFDVNVRIRDNDGGVGAASTPLTVNNVAPTIVLVPIPTASEGASVTLSGTFADVGILDTHSATIDWGDGSPAQAATVDQGSGTGAISATHVYADNGTYTVTVTVHDDDGGLVTDSFVVTIENVNPSLTFTNSPVETNEGDPITLAGLGVGLEDPGFDNFAGGTQESLTALWVDWGDGSSQQALSIATETDGGPGITTKGTFLHDAHVYADNGTYTVTVRVHDDDGPEVDLTFEIVVNNVNPVLTLTTSHLVVLEGQELVLSDLGEFTDPGFDTETFHYTINWGNLTPDQPPKPVGNVTNGGPGTMTEGKFGDSFTYPDNDADNLYTITVTVTDDDGGSDTKTIQVRVLNVNPSFVDLDPGSPQVIVATDVSTQGQTILFIQFVDPGVESDYLPPNADPFQVLVDWGDRLTEPDLDARFVIEDRLNAVPGGTLVYVHHYQGPPDPLHPAADITIRVKIRDDDFYTQTPLGAVGESTIAEVTISNPGIGTEPFRIDTTPQVPYLTFPVRTEVEPLPSNASSAFAVQQNVEVRSTSGEIRVTADRYLILRVIDAEGNAGAGYRLRTEVLENLREFFRTLPDNHYALYIFNPETNSERLVMEVYVRNGKLIDPGDDSEGTRDRPPTDEQKADPPQQDVGSDQSADYEDGEVVPFRADSPRWTRWSALAVGLAASSSSKSWAYRVDRALAKATTEQWRKLQSYNPPKRNKP